MWNRGGRMGMNSLQQKKRRPAPQQAQPRLEQTVRRQLAGAVGAEFFQNRDPIAHVTEDFQRTFDWIGSRKAQALGGMEQEGQMPWQPPGLEGLEGAREGQEDDRMAEPPGQELAGPGGKATDMDRMVSPSPFPGDRMFLNRFSQIAFQRGTLAGAVLRGSGKMMLFSCLKRTAGQSQPVNQRQQKLSEAASQRRNVAGNSPDQVVFNRGQVDGAVGLVVDVLRDARRVVDSMTKLAQGENALPEGSGAETLRRTYPFLSDTRERELLAGYREKLDAAQSPQDRAVLQNAIVKTQALIDKKQQMKQRFTARLREVSDAAAQALADFEQPGFAQELTQLLAGQPALEPPPEDEGSGNPPEQDQDNQDDVQWE